jgi:DNA-binding transcriptional LysR family regulator
MKGLRLISTPLQAANKAHMSQSAVKEQIKKEEQKNLQ